MVLSKSHLILTLSFRLNMVIIFFEYPDIEFHKGYQSIVIPTKPDSISPSKFTNEPGYCSVVYYILYHEYII